MNPLHWEIWNLLSEARGEKKHEKTQVFRLSGLRNNTFAQIIHVSGYMWLFSRKKKNTCNFLARYLRVKVGFHNNVEILYFNLNLMCHRICMKVHEYQLTKWFKINLWLCMCSQQLCFLWIFLCHIKHFTCQWEKKFHIQCCNFFQNGRDTTDWFFSMTFSSFKNRSWKSKHIKFKI